MKIISGNFIQLNVPDIMETNWGNILNDNTFSSITSYLDKAYEELISGTGVASLDGHKLKEKFDTKLDVTPYKALIDYVKDQFGNNVTMFGDFGKVHQIRAEHYVYKSGLAGTNSISGVITLFSSQTGAIVWSGSAIATDSEGYFYYKFTSSNVEFKSISNIGTVDPDSETSGIPIALLSGSTIKYLPEKRKKTVSSTNQTVSGGKVITFNNVDFFYRPSKVEVQLIAAGGLEVWDLTPVTVLKFTRAGLSEKLELMFQSSWSGNTEYLLRSGFIASLTGDIKVTIYG